MNTLITSVISIIFIIFMVINNKKIEMYDDRYINSNMEKCARFCKTTAGCYAFAFDNQNNICYPSREPLSGNPSIGTISGVSTISTLPGQSSVSRISGFPKGSIYEDYYDRNHTFCNKMFTVRLPSKTVSFVDRRSNAIFSCTDKKRLQPKYYYHNNDRFIKIDEGQNFDFLPQVDEYDVNSYLWPRGKLTTDQLDLLRKVPERRLGEKYNDQYETIQEF